MFMPTVFERVIDRVSVMVDALEPLHAIRLADRAVHQLGAGDNGRQLRSTLTAWCPPVNFYASNSKTRARHVEPTEVAPLGARPISRVTQDKLFHSCYPP